MAAGEFSPARTIHSPSSGPVVTSYASACPWRAQGARSTWMARATLLLAVCTPRLFRANPLFNLNQNTKPMSNTNQNPTNLPALVQAISERAKAEDLHMTNLAAYAREVKPRKGKTMTQAIILNFAERLGEIANCLVLQTDPQGNPCAVYVVGAETADSTRLDLSDEEYQQVLDVFAGTPIPLTWMRLSIAEDGSFGEVALKTLNPPVADDQDAE